MPREKSNPSLRLDFPAPRSIIVAARGKRGRISGRQPAELLRLATRGVVQDDIDQRRPRMRLGIG